ncbi:MAG: peptidylprolyl isomerase [Ignavibacteriaceae bacterium]
MPIGVNKVVTLEFTLKDGEGNLIQTTENNEPFVFLTGANQILPKLEEEVDKMLIGSSKNVILEPEDAYGEYDKNAIKKIPVSNFPEGTELEAGMGFLAHSPEGKQMPFTITKVEEENVIADFNHPLAGQKLDFDIKLINVRDATAEELQHGHVHGTGGHNH